MIEAIQQAYEFFERMNISVTSLIVISLILSLTFLFAIREAASWFFKVDQLKRDLKRLKLSTAQLEGEIRSLRVLLTQSKQNSLSVVSPAGASVAPLDQKQEGAPVKPSAPPASFPIVH